MAKMEIHLFKKHTDIYSVWIEIIYLKHFVAIIEFNAMAFDNIGFKYKNHGPNCAILTLLKIVSRKTRDSIYSNS